MLMISLVAVMLIGWCVAAPVGREVYRMPQSTLNALSDRGTVVMEAALARALSAVDAAIVERSKAEASCKGCVPCLFQNCGQRSGSCASAESASVEPSCNMIRCAQGLSDEAERSWALSQLCGFYEHRCSTSELHSDSCIRTMGESCSSRLLQCSLINTMQNLEPATDTKMQAVCGQRVSVKGNLTQPRSRIMGGSPALPGSWPWLVNLQLNGAMMCGGVLVHSSWVLTAAHCFTGSHSESQWTAVVGEFDISKADPDEQVMKVNCIITHPKFNPKTFNNDIALVELSSPVLLSERVTPVCLPTALEPPAGAPCLVAGWGSLYEDGPSADVVMEAKLPLLAQSTCKTTLGKQLLTNTMFCAGYLTGGIDSCQGDSGGPLIVQDQNTGRFHLYGITSWGDGCGEKGKPGVYTRVIAFSDWIQSEIQKSFESREPTCPKLLKTLELSEEQRLPEFNLLCHFYTQSCPSTLDPAACQRLAQDTCQSRLKKCQLRSFLQTLLDLLQGADDYIRDKVDMTFFSQSLPQLVERVYSTTVSTRKRRHAPDAEQVGLFEDVGPLLDDWENYLSSMADSMEPNRSHEPKQHPAEENLFKQVGLFEDVGPLLDDWENYLSSMADSMEPNRSHEPKQHPAEENLFKQDYKSTLQQLDQHLRSTITFLRSRLRSQIRVPALSDLEEHIFGIKRESGSLGVRAEPVVDQDRRDSMLSVSNWMLLVLQALTGRKTESQEATVNETEGLNRTKDLLPSPETINAQESKTKESSVVNGTHSWTSDLQQKGRTMPSSTPSNLPLLLQLSSNRRKHELPKKRQRRQLLERQIHNTGNKVCPGVAESAKQVIITTDVYSWILNITPGNLNMNFQEVMLDLNTKNEHGLYNARVKATVSGRPLTFYCLVGLENEAFYRSMPRIIALALDALKT